MMNKTKKRIFGCASTAVAVLSCALPAFAADPPTDSTAAVSLGGSIVTTVVDAIKSFLSGVGDSIVSLFDGIVINSNGGLTNFATWALVFLGVGLASGVIASVLRKVG